MWAWLAFPVLARVLMASQEADNQLGSKGGLHSDIVIDEEVGDGELIQEKIKPLSKSEQSEWREDLPRSPLRENTSPYDNSMSSLIRDIGSSGPKMFSNKPEDQEQDERNKRFPIKDIRNREPTESWISWISLENKVRTYLHMFSPVL